MAVYVPISDKERDYAVENGWEAPEDAFEKRNIGSEKKIDFLMHRI